MLVFLCLSSSSYQYVDPLGFSVDVQSFSVCPQHHHVLAPQPPHLFLSVCNKDLERDTKKPVLHSELLKMYFFILNGPASVFRYEALHGTHLLIFSSLQILDKGQLFSYCHSNPYLHTYR